MSSDLWPYSCLPIVFCNVFILIVGKALKVTNKCNYLILCFGDQLFAEAFSFHLLNLCYVYYCSDMSCVQLTKK